MVKFKVGQGVIVSVYDNEADSGVYETFMRCTSIDIGVETWHKEDPDAPEKQYVEYSFNEEDGDNFFQIKVTPEQAGLDGLFARD